MTNLQKSIRGLIEYLSTDSLRQLLYRAMREHNDQTITISQVKKELERRENSVYRETYNF